MSKYKNRILKWLKDEFIYVDRDRSDEAIDIHVDAFMSKRQDHSVYITEGIRILDDLIEIARENDWLNDFMPALRINLDDTRAVKRIKIQNMDDIVREMDKGMIPEIILWQKILKTKSGDNYIEIYERGLHGEFSRILNRDFGDNYHIWYSMIYCVCADGHRDRWRKIYIQYNENNAETVKNVKRLTLKKP
ncbi:MAG: hypothetical protein LBI70_01170 [Rickettsiales bacterium]|jgi:hypothetical protein|nr:hypothetical protein [Rickettsiales bacterium]